ncbi:MAG TPA: beta-N-acetylhexosaminidase [Pyrinomonadaceae bacterium]|nr:beta-N-acetylhexosaminidase [Pyrinomonadaceae bacterium]
MQTTSTIKAKLCRAAVSALFICAATVAWQQARAQTQSATARQDGASSHKDEPASREEVRAARRADGSQTQIQVIPKPKAVAPNGESFRLSRGARVVLADPKSEDDRFAAQDFIDDVRATANVSVNIGGRGKVQILVGALSLQRVRSTIEKFGVSVPQDLNEEGYVLVVRSGAVVVAGQTEAGTFYGLQTLKQLVRGEGDGAFLQGAQITDWPSMRWRAVSDDISRGPIPTVEYVERQIRTEAMFKLNMHSFYMEHVFGSTSHPLIAPEGGALTPAEIRELVAYARSYHVELVPEQQTFGHMHKALELEEYSDLAEVAHGDVLSPQAAGTYELVADLYKELDALFPGKFFHIGEDETFELGQGQSRDQVKARGLGPVYFDHLKRVHELLKPYKRRLMFWGDIALNHPDLLPGVPRDMIAMNWDYAARQNYEARIGLFKKAGLDQFVCPGVWSWNQIFPNEDSASVNIVNFVRDGQKAGVLGMMNTEWDDDGESLFENAWYGVTLGAAASWQQAPLDLSEFERDFDWAFFRHEGDELTKATRALGSVNALLGINSSDELFWRDPFTDDFQDAFVRQHEEKTRQMRLAVEQAEETLIRERANVRRNVSTVDSMRFAAARFDQLGRQAEAIERFSRDYWDAYLNLGDHRRVRALRRYTGAVYNTLREQAESLSVLREAYRERWLQENRPYWLESVLARYDLAISRWLSRSKQLEDALREYDRSSTLPPPSEFGLGTRPEQKE